MKDINNFIKDIGEYRKEWIHRISGGAKPYFEKSPNEPDSNLRIMLPMDQK